MDLWRLWSTKDQEFPVFVHLVTQRTGDLIREARDA